MGAGEARAKDEYIKRQKKIKELELSNRNDLVRTLDLINFPFTYIGLYSVLLCFYCPQCISYFM